MNAGVSTRLSEDSADELPSEDGVSGVRRSETGGEEVGEDSKGNRPGTGGDESDTSKGNRVWRASWSGTGSNKSSWSICRPSKA
jgi:hypothetical protein